jgi:hypothetical protein
LFSLSNETQPIIENNLNFEDEFNVDENITQNTDFFLSENNENQSIEILIKEYEDIIKIIDESKIPLLEKNKIRKKILNLIEYSAYFKKEDLINFSRSVLSSEYKINLELYQKYDFKAATEIKIKDKTMYICDIFKKFECIFFLNLL